MTQRIQSSPQSKKDVTVHKPGSNEDFEARASRAWDIQNYRHICPPMPSHRNLYVGKAVIRGTVEWISQDQKVVYVRESCKDSGLFYFWYDIMDVVTGKMINTEESLAITSLLRSINGAYDAESFIFIVAKGRVDLNRASYQRGYVWTEQNKIDFINSLAFEGGAIGPIILAKHAELEGSDVIDGKQRLSTLWDFVTGKIKCAAGYYWEMHHVDRTTFNSAVGFKMELRAGTDEITRLKIFYRVNTTGVPQTAEHLENIRLRIAELENCNLQQNSL